MRHRALDVNLPGFVATAELEKGEILAALGRGDDALDCLRNAVDLRSQLPTNGEDTALRGPVNAYLNSLGVAARKFGYFEEAITAFLRLAELERKRGEQLLVANATSEIGYTYVALGEDKRGKQYLAQAAAIAKAAGNHAEAARWHTQATGLAPDNSPAEPATDNASPTSPEDAYQQIAIAEMLVRHANYEQAINIAQSILIWARDRFDTDLELIAHALLAKAHSDRNQLDEALRETQTAILLADRMNDEPQMLLLRGNLANALIRSGKNNDAQIVLMDGIARSEAMRDRTAGSEFRQAIQAGTARLYEEYAVLLSHFDAHKQLVFVTEGARARNLGGWIEAELQSEVARRPVAAEILELRAIEVEVEVRHLAGRIEANSLAVLTARRDACRDRIKAHLGSRIGYRAPWELPVPEAESFDSMLKALTRGHSGLLTLFSTPEGVCCALIAESSDGFTTTGKFIDWDRDERTKVLLEWVRNPAEYHARTNPGGRFSFAEFEAFLTSFAETTKRLHERLMAQLTGLISESKCERLAIVPHMELAVVPYSFLLDSCPKLHAVTVIPSLLTLYLCESRNRDLRGQTVLVTDPRNALNIAEEARAVRIARSDSQIFQTNIIADIRKAGSRCSLLHFATHGRHLADKPYHSGLAVSTETRDTGIFSQFTDGLLNPVDTPLSTGYQLLTVAEIMGTFSLPRCRLAVLSACETAIPRNHAGGEMTGIPASLLLGGAKSVLATLWPVHSNCTSLFLSRFYQEWRGGRGEIDTPAEALSAARNWLRDLNSKDAKALVGPQGHIPSGDRPFAHPYFSDAFQCYGSW